MKRITLAAALIVCATSALAQDSKPAAPVVDVPAPKCEPKPVFPAVTSQLGAEGRRRAFDRDMRNYKECMQKYMEERKAVTLANQAAYTAAVNEFNGTMKEVNAAIEASREQASGAN